MSLTSAKLRFDAYDKKEGRNSALNLRLRKHIREAIGSPVTATIFGQCGPRQRGTGGVGGTSRVALAESTTDGRLIGFCPDRKLSCGYLVKSSCAACNVIGSGPQQKLAKCNPRFVVLPSQSPSAVAVELKSEPTLTPQTNCLLKQKHGRGCVEAGFFRGPPFRFSWPLTTAVFAWATLGLGFAGFAAATLMAPQRQKPVLP